MNKKLLILIDCQNDFITGTLANPRAEAKIANIVKKVKEHDGIIIATHDTHFTKLQVESAWPPAEGKAYEDTLEGQILKTVHCIKLTEGWEIHPELLEVLNDKTTIKDWYQDEISVNDYDWEQIGSYVSAYGGDEYLGDSEGAERNQLIVECIFETDLICGDYD